MSRAAAPLQALRTALRRFGRTRRNWALVQGLAQAVVAGPGLVLVWGGLDGTIGLPEWPRVLVFAGACGAGLVLLLRALVRHAMRRVDPEQEACLIEQLHGGLDNLLIGALQLGEAQGQPAGGSRPAAHSPALVAALVERAAVRIADLQPARLIDRRRARRYGLAALAVLLAAGALAAAAPGVVAARFSRLAEAWVGVVETLFPVMLTASPGDAAVVRGDPVILGIEARGARRDRLELRIEDARGVVLEQHVLPLDKGRASFRVAAASRDFTYTFAYGQRRFVRHTIRVGERPDIDALNCELTFPSYTGQAPRTLAGKTQKLQALRGTLVLVSLAATTELHAELTAVEWQDGTRQPLTVNGRFAHFTFTVDQPARLRIHLVGRLGRNFAMATPHAIEIGVDDDHAPVVDLRLKGDHATLLPEQVAALAIPYVAEDDFGVAEIALRYTIDTIDPMLNRPRRDGGLTRAIDPAGERVAGKFAEAFKALDPPLQPGDRIRMELAARDNNTETGPGVGRSRSYEIVVVRSDLAAFRETSPGFDGGTAALGGLARLKRNTDLMKEVQHTVRTEKPQAVERQAVESRQSPEVFPSGSEDAVGDYFRLLSGMK